jgi:hypothetical protein
LYRKSFIKIAQYVPYLRRVRMIQDRRKWGTTALIVGFILFIIGMLDILIADWVWGLDDRFRIFGWGWLLQIVGGVFIIYGLMIHLETYIAITRSRFPHGLTSPPLPPMFILDPETKKVIWVVSVAILVMYVISPGLQCQSLLIILLIVGIIYIFSRGGQQIMSPYPPPIYPPPRMPHNRPPERTQAPPKTKKMKICEKCYAQLELEWVACPICGHSIIEKSNEKIKK